jgi:uncharacterized membrane protein YfcA|tara:strand:- start:62 stop:826 length:765 start_codon:yes stop_codon:yes gene_type:complete
MEQIILIIAALITSSISAVIGMGGGIILLGIMAILIPEGYMAIALHGIIQMVSNGTRTFVFRDHIKKNLISEYLIGALIGLGLSVFIVYGLMHIYDVRSANEIKFDYLKPIIGLYILWYLYLKGPKKKRKNKLFMIVGFIGGLCSIFVGAVGPLIAPFFLRNDLNKENVIANKAACQIITHIGKIPIFIYFFNVNYIEQYTILLPLIISVYVGTTIGKKLLQSITEKIFKMTFKICLTIIAIHLILGRFLFIIS